MGSMEAPVGVRTLCGGSTDQMTIIEFEVGEVCKTYARKEGGHARRNSTG